MTDEADLYPRAVAACRRGDWKSAAQMAYQLIARTPGHAGVHYIAGVACMELGRARQAADLLGRATTLDPSRTSFAAAHAKALMLSGDLDGAVAEADRVVDQALDAETLNALGMIYALAQAHQQAAVVLRRAVAMSPDNASCRFTLATMLIFLGDVVAAREEFEACLAANPRYWKAYLALAQLTTHSEEQNHIAKLESILAGQPSDASEACMYLNLAISKEYEDLGDYPRAFNHLRDGKAAGGLRRGYSIVRDQEMFDAIIESTSGDWNTPPGHPSKEPIFVIGMPRSGTTLVDRILSSHPDVQSAGELSNFGTVFKHLAGSHAAEPIGRATLARARDLDWQDLGERYLSSTRPATGKLPHFVDKLPHNFLYAGYIAKALPNARIICLRRHPMDTCLSNFRQLFALNAPEFDYSHDLMDTGRYYLLFNRLVAHWQQLLPGRIFEVGYEDLVDAQELTSRKLLQFCELEWTDNCLDFEKNAASVATASAAQVRKPMYRGAIGRWKSYEDQLTELHDLLGDAGVISAVRQ